MDALVLRLGHTAEAAVSWCLASAPRQVMHGSLAEAAQAAQGHRLTVLVPSSEILLTSTKVPTRRRQQLRQALPFALEEQLASDVDQLHFAIAERGDNEVHCAVLERALMQRWLDALTSAGLTPDALVPDVLTLPKPPGTWSLLIEAQQFMLRYGELRGVAYELDALEHLLPRLLQQQEGQAPTQLHLYEARSDNSPLPVEAWCAEHGIPLVSDSPGGDSLSLLASNLEQATPINLLQGDFGRKEQTLQAWRPWRTAIALAAVLLVLQAGIAATRYVSLAAEEAELAAQIDSIYRTAFPESKRVVDARAQMEQKLKELRNAEAGQEFHRMLVQLAPTVRTPGIVPQSVQYSTGVFELEVRADDLQSLDKLKQAINAVQGLQAEITSADSSGKVIAGHITIRGESK